MLILLPKSFLFSIQVKQQWYRVYNEFWSVINPDIHKPLHGIAEATFLLCFCIYDRYALAKTIQHGICHGTVPERDYAYVMFPGQGVLDEPIPHGSVCGVGSIKIQGYLQRHSISCLISHEFIWRTVGELNPSGRF